jgi:hypothetical protein
VPPASFGILGDDVDDAGIGIRAIQRRTGAAHDFDARDVLDRIAAPDIALVADVGGGDGHAVLQHQHLRIEGADDAAHHIQRRIAVGGAVDVDAGHAFEYLVEVGGAHGGDVGRRDHAGHGRRAAQALAIAGGDADAGRAVYDSARSSSSESGLAQASGALRNHGRAAASA